MEPKITIFSRDKKKKVSLQPAVTSLPSQIKQPQQDPEATNANKRRKPSNEIYWLSSAFQPLKKKKKRNKQEILSIVISIIGAILVGVVMGASILSIFFTNEATYSKNSIDSHLYFPKKEEHKQTQQVFDVYLLQAGIFQQRSGAEEKMRTYRKQGFAAVMSVKPPYRIYLGVSFDHKGATALAKDYQKKGIKVYIKERSIPIQNKKEQTSLSAIFQRSGLIFKELSHLSIQGISQQDHASIHLSTQLTKEYQLMLEEAQRLRNQLPKAEKEKMSKMLQALDQAVQSAKEAKVHPSPALMWQIQEGLVRYVNSF